MGSVIHGASHHAIKHFRENPAAMPVYWVYLARTNHENVAFPSLRGLSRDTGWSVNACKDARQWLVKHQALEKVEGYIRPGWRKLSKADRARKMNFDKSEYYRPTGVLQVGESIFAMLYVGAFTPSDIEEVADVSPDDTSGVSDVSPDDTSEGGSDVSPDTTSSVVHVARDDTELDSIIELDSTSSELDSIKSSDSTNVAPTSDVPLTDDAIEIPGQGNTNVRIKVVSCDLPVKPHANDHRNQPRNVPSPPETPAHRLLAEWKGVLAEFGETRKEHERDFSDIQRAIEIYGEPVTRTKMLYCRDFKRKHGSEPLVSFAYVLRSLEVHYGKPGEREFRAPAGAAPQATDFLGGQYGSYMNNFEEWEREDAERDRANSGEPERDNGAATDSPAEPAPEPVAVRRASAGAAVRQRAVRGDRARGAEGKGDAGTVQAGEHPGGGGDAGGQDHAELVNRVSKDSGTKKI